MRRSSRRRAASIAEARVWNVTKGPAGPAPSGDPSLPTPPTPPTPPIPPVAYGAPPPSPEPEPHPVIPPPPGAAPPPEEPESEAFIPFADATATPPVPGTGEAPPSGAEAGAGPGGWSLGGERRGAVARLRAALSGDELAPGRPGLRVLIVVAVVAALVAVAYWWRSRPHAEPLPAPAPLSSAHGPAVRGAAPTPGGPGEPVSGPPASPSPSATALVVDVAGKVRHPGVVRLPPGSRVVDAIHAAGGVRPGVRTGTLNLARVVADGEQVLVGVAPTTAAAPSPPPPGASSSPGAGTQVSLNNGTEEQFDTLPGVGPVLAKRIVDYRTQHGGFRSVDELGDVPGIGPKHMADLKPLVSP